MNKIHNFIFLLISVFMISCNESEHEFSEWMLVKDSTCIEEGIRQKKCINCEYEIEETISKKEHLFIDKTDESYHYKECSCGEVKEMEEHNYEWIIDIQETDLNNGLKHSICLGCGKEKDYNTEIPKRTKLKQVTDQDLIDAILNYEFYYGYQTDWGYSDYEFLWDGQRNNNELENDKPLEEKINSYLIEYFNVDNVYYLVYMEKQYIRDAVKYLDKLKIESIELWNNHHFSSTRDVNMIDGKYLYGYINNKNDISKLKLFSTTSLEEISLYLDDYQLSFCVNTKKAIIKENISSQDILNHEITYINRVELEFNNGEAELSRIDNDIDEKIVINQLNYIGEYIEGFSKNIEDKRYDYFPKKIKGPNIDRMLILDIVIENNKKYILFLPCDLSLVDSNTSDYNSDFGTHEHEFANAFYKKYDETDSSWYLYEYDKVIEIMRNK